jgi:type III restriction enzyme
LEQCNDVASYAKNYLAVRYKLDYVNADGDISNYYPDFIVRLNDSRVIIVETKGKDDLDVPLKMKRLSQWCDDVNRIRGDESFDYIYVGEDAFKKYTPKDFAELLGNFREYKDAACS